MVVECEVDQFDTSGKLQAIREIKSKDKDGEVKDYIGVVCLCGVVLFRFHLRKETGPWGS